MGVKEEEKNTESDATDAITSKSTTDSSSPVHSQGPNPARLSSSSTDTDAGQPLCRVCHCTESDLRGDSALAFLGIVPPLQEQSETQNLNKNVDSKSGLSSSEKCSTKDEKSSFVEIVSPDGEIFVCSGSDIEAGATCQEDLTNLGCSCKNELSLAHYACALKWFVSHGSTVCEICGAVARNVRITDFKKVLASLKDYDELRTSIITGGLTQLRVENGNTGVDPDAIAGIRRQRLSEISSWFNPRNSSSVVAAASQGQDEMHVSSPGDGENGNNGEYWRAGNGWDARANMRRGMEGTGAFVAVGLICAILAWLIAPHVSKTAAVIGVHLLLGTLCSLTLIIVLRFVVPRAKYGPTRYWMVSFAFLFLVFGVWVSRTHNIRSS